MASSAGYYTVRIETDDHVLFHTVYAASDYEAAIKVKLATGHMALSQRDVTLIEPTTAAPLHEIDMISFPAMFSS